MTTAPNPYDSYPFRGLALQASPDTLRGVTMRRVLFATLIVVLLGLSGARLADDARGGHLRADTRAAIGTHLVKAQRVERVATPYGFGPGDRPAARVVARLRPPAVTFARPTSSPRPVLSVAPPGAVSHTGAPKRERWATLGGLGRYGAG